MGKLVVALKREALGFRVRGSEHQGLRFRVCTNKQTAPKRCSMFKDKVERDASCDLASLSSLQSALTLNLWFRKVGRALSTRAPLFVGAAKVRP